MTNDEELGKQRLAAWQAHLIALTDDTKQLIETLKQQSPESWTSYVKTVDEEGRIEDAAYTEILRTARALFPERGAEEIGNLVLRMHDLTRGMLGKPLRHIGCEQ